jgi:5'-nucleotidase
MRGIEVTEQGKRDLQTAMLDRRVDARGNPYYWIGFKRGRSQPPEGSDLNAIHQKRISVTPLHLNLTEFRERERLKSLIEDRAR